MPDTHIIYAVLDRPTALLRPAVRLSEPMSYDDALTRHGIIDSYMWPASFGITAAHMLISYVCVRSTDDPNWPADAPLVTVRRNNGTTLYNGRMDRFEGLSD